MALLEAMMDGTLHIDGRVSDAMVVRAMRAVAIDGLGMPADLSGARGCRRFS